MAATEEKLQTTVEIATVGSNNDPRLGRAQTFGLASMSQKISTIQRDKTRFARISIQRSIVLGGADVTREKDSAPRESSLCKLITASALILIFGILGIASIYLYNDKPNYNTHTYAIYDAILVFGSLLLLLLDYFNAFHKFQYGFESMFGGRGQTVFLVSFCLLAFIDYVLISLNEDAVVDGAGVFWVIEILYYVSLALLFSFCMAWWKPFAFYSSEKSWIHALLYLSIVGYVVIVIARWVRPVPSDESETGDEEIDDTSWHRKHKTKKILSTMTNLLIFGFLFFVLLTGFGIPAFAEFARWTSKFGVGIALTLFCVLSMVIMLTPLAPGSVVDACGGFVFILLLVGEENYSFFASWVIAVLSIVHLHYLGACTQWWMGTWRCVQIWGNCNLPVEMLAASDAVLRDASWFKVGLVAFIFMDTANGLNQGRINMHFWTQLFSEWPAYPNAFGLVSLGATVAMPALDVSGYDWTVDAVPLLIIMAMLIQFVGVTFGTNAMASSVDTVKYWTSREKWTAMQYFRDRGYATTKEGWENDVFNLANNDSTITPEFTSILYEKIAPIHKDYIDRRNATKDAEQRLAIYKEYQSTLQSARDEHYENDFQILAEAGFNQGWFVEEIVPESAEGFFDQEGIELPLWKLRLWMGLVGILVVTGWASFYGIYWQVDLTTSVQEGLGVVGKFEAWAWACLVIFSIDILFIYHIEMINATRGTLTTMKWVFTGCKIHPDVETKFKTPEWECPQQWKPSKKSKKALQAGTVTSSTDIR